MAAFAGYCQSYARWKEAEEFITRHGAIVKTPSGYWQQVSQVSIAQQYLKDMHKFVEQFGLTPASRSQIVANVHKNEYIDEMDKINHSFWAGYVTAVLTFRQPRILRLWCLCSLRFRITSRIIYCRISGCRRKRLICVYGVTMFRMMYGNSKGI